MIDLERRLQHAARELRELDIEPPPLAALGDRRRPGGLTARVPALVMPVLFVIGGLAVVAGGMDRQIDVPDAPPVEAAVTVVLEPEAVDAEKPRATTPPLTARQEIALISSLRPGSARPATEPAVAAPTSDLRTLSQRYR